ncbi:MAG: hypothetical protein Q8Q09_16135 [Deltaproteobacteria bacterium]|nr:hypothetical protein [Deltaproteobacteria bacterium]
MARVVRGAPIDCAVSVENTHQTSRTSADGSVRGDRETERAEAQGFAHVVIVENVVDAR